MGDKNPPISLRDAIFDLADDTNLIEIVESELGVATLERLQARLRRIRDTHYFIAVLGRQGVGKSSLLNALLFRRRVLPMDVTETTNILCKVVGDQGRGPGVEIKFRDGRQTKGPVTSNFLGQFVDEQRNTGNAERVLEVVVRHPHPLLQSGIAFVDTPGVGSLIDQNSQTTIDFLPKVAGAVFVFSTTPTILDSEVDFLEETWDFARHFFFVQNVWGEDAASLESAGQHNLETLSRIAKKRDDDPSRLRLYTVNIHAALMAATSGETQGDDTSGIGTLSDALKQHVGSGVARLRHVDTLADARLVVQRARTGASQRLRELEDRSLRTSRDFDEKAAETRQQVRAARDAWKQACDVFEESARQAGSVFDTKLTNEFKELSSEFMSNIEARTTDPDHLVQAAQEQVRFRARAAISVYEDGFKKAVESLMTAYDLGSRHVANAVDGVFQDAKHGAEVDLEESIRTAGGFAANVGGMAFMALTGEAALIYFGTISGTIPGVGLIIAAVVIAIGFTVKKAAERRVKDKLKDAFRRAFDDAEHKLREAAHRHYRDQGEEIKRRLDRELRELLSDAEGRLCRLEDDRMLSTREAEHMTIALQERLGRSALLLGRICNLHAMTETEGEITS